MLRIDYIEKYGEEVILVTADTSEHSMAVHRLNTGIVVEHDIEGLETLLFDQDDEHVVMAMIMTLLE